MNEAKNHTNFYRVYTIGNFYNYVYFIGDNMKQKTKKIKLGKHKVEAIFPKRKISLEEAIKKQSEILDKYVNKTLLEKYWNEFVKLKSPHNYSKNKKWIIEFAEFVIHKREADLKKTISEVFNKFEKMGYGKTQVESVLLSHIKMELEERIFGDKK